MFFGIAGILIILIAILLFNNCTKDCYDFDTSICPKNSEQYIVLRFNMDSTNLGFTNAQLENFEITYAREYYTELRQPVTKFLGFDSEKFIFKAMYSFYCCTDENAGFKMFNNNTGRIQTVTKVKFKKESSYDYCCGFYYYVKSFEYNGNKMNGGDTIYINND